MFCIFSYGKVGELVEQIIYAYKIYVKSTQIKTLNYAVMIDSDDDYPIHHSFRKKGTDVFPIMITGPLVSALLVTIGARMVMIVGAFLVTIGTITSSHATEIWHLYLTFSVIIGRYNIYHFLSIQRLGLSCFHMGIGKSSAKYIHTIDSFA